MRLNSPVLALVALLATGCTTTEEALQLASQKWVGQSSDTFFARHGVPKSQFTRQDGGVLYTWRGGEAEVRRALAKKPENFGQPKPFNNSAVADQGSTFNRTVSSSSTTVRKPNANTTVTKTRSSSSSVNVDLDRLLEPSPSPASQQKNYRIDKVYCELQINTDGSGTIIAIRKVRDTSGISSLSRCDEVLNR